MSDQLIDQTAFADAVRKLGEPDVVQHWQLDEGNLRWFLGEYLHSVNQTLNTPILHSSLGKRREKQLDSLLYCFYHIAHAAGFEYDDEGKGPSASDIMDRISKLQAAANRQQEQS